MWLTVLVDLVMAGGSFLIADGLFGSLTVRDQFMKAGLSGKDLNKRSESKM